MLGLYLKDSKKKEKPYFVEAHDLQFFILELEKLDEEMSIEFQRSWQILANFFNKWPHDDKLTVSHIRQYRDYIEECNKEHNEMVDELHEQAFDDMIDKL